MSDIAELLTTSDRGTFRRGDVIRCKMLPTGDLVPMRRWTERVAEDLFQALFPFTGQAVRVTNVDVNNGIITLGDR